jgi:membrane protein DedA with SNARE-associated domain
MPMAGFAAAKGEMHLGWAIAAGSAGSLAGATGWYFVGCKIGERRLRSWVEQHGRWITLSNEDIDRARDWFQKYGPAVVFFGRLIPGLRTWISVPAGLNAMPLFPFLLYSLIGTILWTALLTWAGYFLGGNYELVEKFVGPLSTGVFVLFACWYVYRLLKRKGRQEERS